MNTRIDPNFKKVLQKFGNNDWNECFHCGNCTASCSLTEQGSLFPRKEIRLLQMGLKKKIIEGQEPWLCYYCGDCSETCPRDANPGELMMVLRRYLTIVYDWTGLAKLFFSSVTATVIAFVLVAVAILGIGYGKGFNPELIMEFGHKFEKLAILGVAGFILLPNLIRMFWFTAIKGKIKAPFISYITRIWDMILHTLTQKKALKCEENTFRWLEHFLVVIGYLLLLLITVFLNWFSTENIYIVYGGYAVGAITFIITFDFIIRRIRKKSEISKFSHYTDWTFVVWLFLMGLSAVLVRMFIDLEMINNNLWLYMVHLIILAQWAVLIVPFGKWTHFLYRSFAIYIAGLKKSAMIRQNKNDKVIVAA